jgi:hypothetical protein
MNSELNSIIWRQLGAAIDMLRNAIDACPDELWRDRSRTPEFWYVAFHTLFFLDLYLSGTLEGFMPPAPFTLTEIDPSGRMPERVYTRSELRSYLAHCRSKCKRLVLELTPERAAETCTFDWLKMDFGELFFCSLRHVQHHTAQLNLILRQQTNSAPRWVSIAE